MVTRREFLKTAAAAAGAGMLHNRESFGRAPSRKYFALHDFIENHPDAVFVFRTNITAKTDTDAIRALGHRLGNSLFVAKNSPIDAFSVSAPIAIKPNMTAWSKSDPAPATPFEAKMGIQTDANFVEGIIGSLLDLTVRPADVHIIEANYHASMSDGAWYGAMAQRNGITLREKAMLSSLTPKDIQWTPVPNGVYFKSIPHLWPVNAPGSPLINIAKLKSHGLGITLCSKNLQGTIARPYVLHCRPWNIPIPDVSPSDVVEGAFTTIRQNYEARKHSIPRWKTLDGDPEAGRAGGLRVETHTARCLDNNSVLRPLVNIIEGVYGREGPFVTGPGSDGLGVDIMTNMIILGKNARHVDIIGVYLAGNEPGNFGLFHVAKERRLSTYLNPHDVPLYEWKTDGNPTLTPLDRFPRAAIRTLYLPQPREPEYHLVNQPYDYSASRKAV